MIRKPTSGDSEQREREASRARQHSQISPAGGTQSESAARGDEDAEQEGGRPVHGSERESAHGASEGESAHGAIPRRGIDSEQSDRQVVNPEARP